jgi:hypothetical protein
MGYCGTILFPGHHTGTNEAGIFYFEVMFKILCWLGGKYHPPYLRYPASMLEFETNLSNCSHSTETFGEKEHEKVKANRSMSFLLHEFSLFLSEGT